MTLRFEAMGSGLSAHLRHTPAKPRSRQHDVAGIDREEGLTFPRRRGDSMELFRRRGVFDVAFYAECVQCLNNAVEQFRAEN